jgi:uncharacterized protein YciI
MKKRRFDLSKEVYLPNQSAFLIGTINPKSLHPRSKMPWFVKIEEGIVDKAIFDQYVPAHKAFVRDLIAKGHRAKTGYWTQRGGGMLLFEAASLDEANAIIAQDPLVQNKCVNYKIHEWCIIVE